MYQIIVGIPSYNEGPNIKFVAEQIDAGLQKYYPNKKAIIVNVDGGSTDDTGSCFNSADTVSEKKRMQKKGVSGKGNVFKMLFEFVAENETEAIMVCDADLRSINPEWVKHLLKPVYDGYDLCTPLYSRHKYDGTITNNIIYPLIYGLYGLDVRQPIGGDFSFSKKAVKHWLSQEWYNSTLQFGIDNFMTTSAITGGLKICQVGLGTKVHKPSAPNLGRMFIEVSDTFFRNILKSKKHFKTVKEVKEAPVFGIELEEPQDLQFDQEEIKQKAEEGLEKHEPFYKDFLGKLHSKVGLEMNAQTWCEVVYAYLKGFEKNKTKDFLETFSVLYFARVYSFITETIEMNNIEAEAKIKEQAQLFFENRKLFIDA